MSQASRDWEISRAHSQRGTRPGMFLGVLVGMVAALVLVVVVWGGQQALFSGHQTFTTTCRGASVTGTTWVTDGGSVVVSVVVDDERARSWDVAWGRFGDEVAGSTMTPAPDPRSAGTLHSTVQFLGDTDDGTQRTAQVRPRGQRAWCDLDMHVSWLW